MASQKKADPEKFTIVRCYNQTDWFKVKPAIVLSPGSRVRRVADGDKWVVKESWSIGPRRAMLVLNAGPYEAHIGDEFEVTWRNPVEYDRAGRVRRA